MHTQAHILLINLTVENIRIFVIKLVSQFAAVILCTRLREIEKEDDERDEMSCLGQMSEKKKSRMWGQEYEERGGETERV